MEKNSKCLSAEYLCNIVLWAELRMNKFWYNLMSATGWFSCRFVLVYNSAIIHVIFFCFGDKVMIVLYGDNYEGSGEFFQIKLLVNFFTLIVYGPLILSIGGQKFYYKAVVCNYKRECNSFDVLFHFIMKISRKRNIQSKSY